MGVWTPTKKRPKPKPGDDAAPWTPWSSKPRDPPGRDDPGRPKP